MTSAATRNKNCCSLARNFPWYHLLFGDKNAHLLAQSQKFLVRTQLTLGNLTGKSYRTLPAKRVGCCQLLVL
jgi:hypothetical protein